MVGTIEFQIWKQRREEMLQEAAQDRLARTLRGSRKRRRGGRVPLLMPRPEKAQAASVRARDDRD